MRIYIIGGGSSVTKEVYEKLNKEREKGHKIFAVNNSYRFIDCDFLVFLDRVHFLSDDVNAKPRNSLGFDSREAYANLKCKKFSRFFVDGSEQRVIPTDKFKKDLPLEKGSYCGGACLMSGIGAISIARQMGFNDIVLCGYDGGAIDGQTHHFHIAQPEQRYTTSNEKYHVFRGEPIRNTSMRSNINIFPKEELDEIINTF